MLKDFDFTVAIPAPTLYGQFKDRYSIDSILTALKSLGFDDIFEAAESADIVTSELKKALKTKPENIPWISSSCPAIVRLIQIRYPGLLDQIVRIESPMEIAARIIKEDLYPDKKNIGVFFISPCPAKITAARSPIGSKESAVDGVIAINNIFLDLQNALDELKEVEPLGKASSWGISWARSEGESHSTLWPETVAVDGIDNVINFLEELENGKIKHVDFIEAIACPGGCVGGALTVENPYISKARIIRKAGMIDDRKRGGKISPQSKALLTMKSDIVQKHTLSLDPDFKKALEKMARMEEIIEILPGLDCGSCGAPTCRALAEDIVLGKAKKNDCIFILRDEIKKLTENLAELGSWMAPLFADDGKKNDK
jgi:iron only hydrogenase large subunit-like protein